MFICECSTTAYNNIRPLARKMDILLTLGAGDISSLVNPIKEVLN